MGRLGEGGWKALDDVFLFSLGLLSHFSRGFSEPVSSIKLVTPVETSAFNKKLGLGLFFSLKEGFMVFPNLIFFVNKEYDYHGLDQ